MKYIAALIGAVNAVSVNDYNETSVHTHTSYGTEERFRDVEVYYDEIEYAIETKTETEVRTRQIPVQTTCDHVETKYRPEEELRYTKAFEIKYRDNHYIRHTFEPRVSYGYYVETKYRDVPFTSYETHYEIFYREEEEHRYRNEIEILERADTVTSYIDEAETRFTNEYQVLYREETETRYNTVFDDNVRVIQETRYRTESETRTNTIYEVEYQEVTTTQTREVPVISYETAYRDEETVTYDIEYETRTRDVPVEREVVGYFSNDSGDGVESDPEVVVSAEELEARQAAADAAAAAAAQAQADALAAGTLVLDDLHGDLVLLDAGHHHHGLGGHHHHGLGAHQLVGGHGLGLGLGLGARALDYGWAQTGDYAKFATADSSDDEQIFTVTDYVTEEYQVAKKVPRVTVESVPY